MGKIIVGIIFIIATFFLFIEGKYGYGVILLLALVVLLKSDSLTEFAFKGFRAKFKTSADKIEGDIKENQQPITNQNFIRFQNIESKILYELQKRYGGEMKTLVHFMYGHPDKPEFTYTPDGALHTEDALYFFEIKYVLKPEFAKKIVTDTLKYLEGVYSKLLPSTGDKKFVIKLILASGYDLSDMKFDLPNGIEIEFFKV